MRCQPALTDRKTLFDLTALGHLSQSERLEIVL